jgi:alpha/beta superfamily hydrolase
MNAHTQVLTIAGPAGAIDLSVDLPQAAPRGLALVAHPHPLFGGTKDNKAPGWDGVKWQTELE